MDKGTLLNIILLVLVLTGVLMYYYREHQKEKFTKKVNAQRKKRSASSFIERLEQLGYFQFTPPEVVDSVKVEMGKHYERYGELTSVDMDNHPVCHRLFSADEEELFEEGGMIAILKYLKFAFEVRGLQLEINKHFEQYKNKDANQWVILNNRKYILYNNVDSSFKTWEYATTVLGTMLNDELRVQGSNEQFYTVSGGNDAKLILLTKAQYDFIINADMKEELKPRSIRPQF